MITGTGHGEASAGEASVPQSAGTKPAVAIAAELTGEAETTQLVFTLSREVTARTFLMERPDRVIVDLPEVNFHLPAQAGQKRAGVVSSFRYGLFAPGRSRIVIDLAQPALVSRADVAEGSDGVALLRIELTRADRQAFRKAAEAFDPAAEITSSLPEPPANRAD